MKGPEGEKKDKRKEKDPLEVASYDKPWWLRACSLPGTPRDGPTVRTQICVHVKDPISISCKRVGLRAGGMVTHKNNAFTRLGINYDWVA